MAAVELLQKQSEVSMRRFPDSGHLSSEILLLHTLEAYIWAGEDRSWYECVFCASKLENDCSLG